jgi:hypothetical protein
VSEGAAGDLEQELVRACGQPGRVEFEAVLAIQAFLEALVQGRSTGLGDLPHARSAPGSISIFLTLVRIHRLEHQGDGDPQRKDKERGDEGPVVQPRHKCQEAPTREDRSINQCACGEIINTVLAGRVGAELTEDAVLSTKEVLEGNRLVPKVAAQLDAPKFVAEQAKGDGCSDHAGWREVLGNGLRSLVREEEEDSGSRCQR